MRTSGQTLWNSRARGQDDNKVPQISIAQCHCLLIAEGIAFSYGYFLGFRALLFPTAAVDMLIAVI